jgi:hypothetical protein
MKNLDSLLKSDPHDNMISEKQNRINGKEVAVDKSETISKLE